MNLTKLHTVAENTYADLRDTIAVIETARLQGRQSGKNWHTLKKALSTKKHV